MDPIPNKADKEARLQDLRESVAKLEAELQREVELEQHEAIDNLETYFETVENKLQHLKTFWIDLRSDLKKTLNKN